MGAPSRNEARLTPEADEAAPEVETTAAPGASPAVTPATTAQKATTPFDLTTVVSQVLKNDLEVLLQPTPGAPQVSVCTAIDAGSRLDPAGAPGAFRVLGEMLKDGGYRSSAQDYVALVAERGGTSEVTVTRDATTFCTTVPAAELPLALWVTAGRFTAGALSEASLRAAVDHLAKESEFTDAQVRAGRAPERLRRMAFLGTYEYAHPTLPNPDDLDSLTLAKLRDLHRESYVARRSKVAVSGGFDLEKATHQLSEHLYAARSGQKASYRLPELVPQSTPRFSMAEDHSAKTPVAWYGWVAPPGAQRLPMELALLSLISDKRLGSKLVGPGRAAQSLDLSLDEESSPEGYGLFRLEIVGSNSQSLGTIEKGFEDELKLVTQGLLKGDEIVEAQRHLREKRAEALLTPLGRAKQLARGVLLGKTTDEVLSPLKEGAPLAEVSADDVRTAALSLLAGHKRSSIEIYPQGWQDPWQEPMRLFHIVNKGETLSSIATKYATTVAVITKMNNIKQTQTLYPGDKLRVPRGKAPQAEKKPRVHVVRRGDTMSGLALKYGVSVRDIADANGMGAKLIIRTGETLQIPWGSSASSTGSGASSSAPASTATPGGQPNSGGATPAAASAYVVKSGDTLSQIAASHGVSTVALARANGISDKAMVKVGQSLSVPPRGTGKNLEPEPIVYVVQKGDTLSGIARKHGVTVASISSENQLGQKATLHPGQKLKIPRK
jgi:LysM repeat protein/predicted Zn-dependent peptidase